MKTSIHKRAPRNGSLEAKGEAVTPLPPASWVKEDTRAGRRRVDDHQSPPQETEHFGYDPDRAFCDEGDAHTTSLASKATTTPNEPTATDGPDSALHMAVELEPKIKIFIVKYLNPKVTYTRFLSDPWASLIRDAQQLNWPVVHKLIRSLNYEDYFLRTLYWRIVADKVKERDRFTCQRCGRTERLEAHHITRDDKGSYVYHGSEHLHLDDLRTLCAVCHRVEHGQIVRAVIAEWEMDDDFSMLRLQLEMEGFSIPKRGGDETSAPCGLDRADAQQQL